MTRKLRILDESSIIKEKEFLGYQSINCHCRDRKREVPLIFGELICFSEKAWSCWSSF
jgi:hypothetical protein